MSAAIDIDNGDYRIPLRSDLLVAATPRNMSRATIEKFSMKFREWSLLKEIYVRGNIRALKAEFIALVSPRLELIAAQAANSPEGRDRIHDPDRQASGQREAGELCFLGRIVRNLLCH